MLYGFFLVIEGKSCSIIIQFATCTKGKCIICFTATVRKDMGTEVIKGYGKSLKPSMSHLPQNAAAEGNI